MKSVPHECSTPSELIPKNINNPTILPWSYPHLEHEVLNLLVCEVSVLLDDDLELLVDTLCHGTVAAHVDVTLLPHHLLVHLLTHLHQQVLHVRLRGKYKNNVKDT